MGGWVGGWVEWVKKVSYLGDGLVEFLVEVVGQLFLGHGGFWRRNIGEARGRWDGEEAAAEGLERWVGGLSGLSG